MKMNNRELRIAINETKGHIKTMNTGRSKDRLEDHMENLLNVQLSRAKKNPVERRMPKSSALKEIGAMVEVKSQDSVSNTELTEIIAETKQHLRTTSPDGKSYLALEFHLSNLLAIQLERAKIGISVEGAGL